MYNVSLRKVLLKWAFPWFLEKMNTKFIHFLIVVIFCILIILYYIIYNYLHTYVHTNLNCLAPFRGEGRKKGKFVVHDLS